MGGPGDTTCVGIRPMLCLFVVPFTLGTCSCPTSPREGGCMCLVPLFEGVLLQEVCQYQPLTKEPTDQEPWIEKPSTIILSKSVLCFRRL